MAPKNRTNWKHPPGVGALADNRRGRGSFYCGPSDNASAGNNNSGDTDNAGDVAFRDVVAEGWVTVVSRARQRQQRCHEMTKVVDLTLDSPTVGSKSTTVKVVSDQPSVATESKSGTYPSKSDETTVTEENKSMSPTKPKPNPHKSK